MKKYKLAIVAPVPFYYHTPFYRKLSESEEIDLNVFYCSEETLSGEEVRKTYLSEGQITGKDYLLDGYKYKFLKNYSRSPSFLNWPFGLINIGIWNEIRKGRYDAVVLQSWTNLTWWLAFLACLFYKTPVFFMTDSNILFERLKPRWKMLIKGLIMRFLFKRASSFFTSGTNNEQFYRHYGVSEEKIFRVPFSWGYEWFLLQAEKVKPEREKIRESFGVSKDDFVLLYVGRMSYEKAPLFLLRAYNKAKVENKKLFFVGNGPMRPNLGKEVEREKIKGVHFMGFQPREKISNFYAAADALVLPSRAETWGIVVNEAMCFGLPVIASDQVGAAVDLIKDGYNGFIFKVNDMDTLSDSIEKLINMPKAEKQLFGERSNEIIRKWIESVDPVGQVIRAIESTR